MSVQDQLPCSSLGATADVLGVLINRMSLGEALATIEGFIKRSERRTVVFPNPFCVTQSRRDRVYRLALNGADLRLADGWPVVWASRWMGAPAPERLAGPDLFVALNDLAEQAGYSVYLLGGAVPKNSERVAETLRVHYPRLRIVGTFSPPTGPVEEALADAVLRDIARCQPDILWVGLGSPMQETWLHRHRNRIEASVSLAVGGTFNYYNGTRRRAPKWMCECGLEWAHRIAQDPTLIWKKRFYSFPTEFFLPVWRQAMARAIALRVSRF